MTFTLHPLLLEGITLGLGAMLLLVEGFFGRNRRLIIAWAGIVGLFAVFVLTFFIDPAATNRFVATDSASLFFRRFLLLSTIIVLVLAMEFRSTAVRYLKSSRPNAGIGEFLAIPVISCAGLMWLASAKDFVMMFVALELVTISFYILVAYLRNNRGSLEAGVKYLILGALSTGFIVYGIVWLYGVSGQLTFEGVAAALPVRERGNETALLFAFALLLTGLGFKVAAVPFHIWVPDVYQGAPTPVTAFLSVASKAAGFAVMMRVLEVLYHAPMLGGKIGIILAIITGATLIYGNLAAIPQTNVKRLLGYSSIAHAGYLLLGVISHSGPAVALYLATYLPMTFVAFLVLIAVSNAVGGDSINDFAGLKTRSPLLAGSMLIAILSLAGIPLTSGFVGKALVFLEAVKSGHFLLVAVGAVTVATGFYYYLKIIRTIYWTDAPEAAGRISVGLASAVVLVILCAAIVAFGLFPGPLVEWSGFPTNSGDFSTAR